MLFLVKPLRNSTAISRHSCGLPGSRSFNRRVPSAAARISAPITSQDTTTDRVTGIPPKSGIVKATGVWSSSIRRTLICSKKPPPIDFRHTAHTGRRPV